MSPSIKVTKRSLSKHEANILSQEIKLTPNISGYLPQQLMKLNDVLVADSKEGLIGILAYVETNGFIDLKVFIVREKFRDKGYGTLLFEKFMKDFKFSKKLIYTVTKNQTVIHLIKNEGFMATRLFRLPIPCILHQLKMIFSLYRIKESVRKYISLRSDVKFSYWIRPSYD